MASWGVEPLPSAQTSPVNMVQMHALAVYESTGTGLWACNDPTEKAIMQNARIIPAANLRNIKMYLTKET